MGKEEYLKECVRLTLEAKKFNSVPLSILDVAGVKQGKTPRDSFLHSVRLAQHVEKLGFNRYWFAEHHNMPGIASSATSLLIGHIAGATERLRVGSGGVMLPNHAPLVIAEQFGTLESLYPGRIDLGLGRAPGTDYATAQALRRTLLSGGEDFPEQLEELRSYFEEDPDAQVRAVPGEGLDIPIWLLGSSGFSAELSAQLGLPFSFASHFAPAFMMQALQIYHQQFRPSKHLQEPYTMLAVNVIAADTDEEAEWLSTSIQQQFVNMSKGLSTKTLPPKRIEWTPQERSVIAQALGSKATIVGSKATVEEKLRNFINETKTNEIMINSPIYDEDAQLRSLEIIGELMA